MDFFRSFLGDILTIAGYCAVFAGIHKLFLIGTTLNEIKEVLQSQRRLDLASPAAAPLPLPLPSRGLTSEESDDAAAAYAQNLLRAVNAEHQRSEAEPKTV